MSVLPYDKTNPSSIEEYAKRLIGHTFLDVLKEEDGNIYKNRARKGGLGNLLEEKYFLYKANNESKPDFDEAGVELKASPYEILRDGRTLRAGERLVLSMIDYNHEIGLKLKESHLWEKCSLLLLIYYHRDRSIMDNLLYRIGYVSLFTPPEEDLKVIENDYLIIAAAIQHGEAHLLSEASTFYLGASTKGATAATSIVPQFYGSHIPAKKRAFCYKQQYMTYVLRNYLTQGIRTYDPIVKDQSSSLSSVIRQKLNRFKGQTEEDLLSAFHLTELKAKDKYSLLVFKMLGVSSNNAEEFVKANVQVKTIRVEEDGTIREHMSFPTYKYKELVKEEWETSTLRTYFEETKFLFSVFQKKGSKYYFAGYTFWNMPTDELDSEVRNGWQAVVDTIRDGVILTRTPHCVLNNLPKKSDNRIIHTRPHASKSYYKFADGTVIGEGNEACANELPNGEMMPNYCFWLNKEYIREQLIHAKLIEQ